MASTKIAELDRRIAETRAELARLQATKQAAERSAETEKVLGRLARLNHERMRLMNHQFSN